MRYQRIRDLREDADLYQKQLAQMLNCSQQTYSDYECGKVDIPTEVLIRLADFYGTTTDYSTGAHQPAGGPLQGQAPPGQALTAHGMDGILSANRLRLQQVSFRPRPVFAKQAWKEGNDAREMGWYCTGPGRRGAGLRRGCCRGRRWMSLTRHGSFAWSASGWDDGAPARAGRRGQTPHRAGVGGRPIQRQHRRVSQGHHLSGHQQEILRAGAELLQLPRGHRCLPVGGVAECAQGCAHRRTALHAGHTVAVRGAAWARGLRLFVPLWAHTGTFV